MGQGRLYCPQGPVGTDLGVTDPTLERYCGGHATPGIPAGAAKTAGGLDEQAEPWGK